MKNIKQKHILNLLYPIWNQYNIIKAYLLKYPKSGNGFEAISRSKMLQYNKVRFHGAKSIFCHNPYVNIFFNIKGDAIACCRSHKTVLGKYPNQSIKEIWYGERFEKMREHMLHNDLNMGCDYCKLQIESNRFHSLPSMHPEEFANIKKITYPQTMELELSNKCNLQCVMCSGRVSSSIREHRDNLPPIISPYDDEFVEQLKEFIPHLKNISFYGGEPFLIDIYYKIWEQIIKINPKVQIFVVTNGTIYNKRIENLLNNAKFNFLVSIDSLQKEKFEKIRIGANFENVMANLEKFIKHSNGQLAISHTPMKINWMDTPEIVNFCNDKDIVLNLSYVEKPAHFALWAYPPEELNQVISFYEKAIINVNSYSYRSTYNTNVFNEWKEQIKFFRNKNADILSSFGNLDTKYKEYKIILIDTLKTFFKNVPEDWMSFDSALKIISTEILEAKQSPAQIEGMQTIIRDFNDTAVIKQPIAKEFLGDVNKFSNYVKDIISEDAFWARYY